MPPIAQSLDGPWTLHGGPGAAVPAHPDAITGAGLCALPALVPGNVEQALQAAGLAPDPLVAPGTWDYVRYETWGWWYERVFTAEPALLAAGRVELVLEGLDCLGSVWLNGVHLGDTANALIEHRLDARAALRPGANRLCIRVSSGVREARAAGLGPVAATHQGSCTEALRLRKAAHQFGWDIMPRLVSAGLWRPVRLEAVPEHGIAEAYWTTLDADAGRGTATVVVDWSLRLPDEGWERWTVRIAIGDLHKSEQPQAARGSAEGAVRGRAAPGAEATPGTPGAGAGEAGAPASGGWGRWEAGICAGRGRRILRLDGVPLWWPRGWGEPARHTARLELVDPAGRVVHVREERIGIRTVRLRRSEALAADGAGRFDLVVNGERCYLRGTNWVPLDALHSRDRAHLDAALDLLAESNCNAVRMWGGNVYEHDDFYEWCDAHGMLVWQDFAIGCGNYPQDDAFAAAIGAEAAAVVRRLRNRPSLALWCGSNETDQAYAWRWPGLPLDPNRDRITRQVLAQAVADHDPAREYLPSSPYLSPAVMAGGGQPEDHLWGPRDDFKGTYYRASPACFVSEIGYHGCPERASLERMVAPGTALWPVEGNAALLPLSVQPLPGDRDYLHRNGLMARQAAQLIGRAPRDLDEFVLASQLSQAEALKSFIETWRARKGRTGGLLWWNLRDGWPIISDAVVDWYGRRKLAFAAVRASQQEVAVLVEEAADWQHRVVAVNDLRTPVLLDLAIEELGGGVLWRGRVAVAANATAEACRLPQRLDGCACWRLRWTRFDSGGEGNGAPSRPDGAAAEGWSADRMGEAHPPMPSPAPQARANPDKGRGAGPQGRGGEGPEQEKCNHYIAGPRPWPLERLARWYRDLGLHQET